MIEQTTKTVGPRNWKFRNIEEVFNDMIKDSILAWIKDRRALVSLYAWFFFLRTDSQVFAGYRLIYG